MKIAVYAIAKNEGQFVQRFMDSITDADCVVVFDTGSVDNTVTELRKRGALVTTGSISPWRFDIARNTALSLIPDDIDICVVMDLDEVMDPGWRNAIELAWVPGSVTRLRYKFVASHNDDGSDATVLTRNLIHARHGYRWDGPAHECLIPEPGFVDVPNWCDAVCRHYPDPNKSRGNYLEILERAYVERQDDARRVFYLAREYYYYGKNEKAKELFEKHVSMPTSLWPAERAESMRLLAQVDPANNLYWLRKSVAEDPLRRDQWVDLAQCCYDRGDWAGGLSAALSALSITDRGLSYMTYPLAWSDRPYDLAAICAWNLGAVSIACEHGATAARLNPGDQRIQNNLSVYLGGMSCA